MVYTKKTPLLAIAATTLALAGCSQHMRPEMSSIPDSLNKQMAETRIPTSVIIPEAAKPAPGSLWQPGNKQFFKDSRATKVGDIVTIIVSETAEANTEANTETTRTQDSDSNIGNLLNLEGILASRHILDPAAAASNLIDTDSNRTYTGEGSTDRKDNLTANIAAVVTQVLPNGYLLVQGKREVVVNYELQELQIQGIVRPEDISSNNTIMSNKIAEARIFYAGRGIVDQTQTPQYGVRFLEKVMPF